MHTRTAAAATATLLLTITLTACASTPPEKHGATPPRTPPPTATQDNSPTPKAKPIGPRALGEPLHWSGSGNAGTTTVLSYRQPIPNVEPPNASGETGEEWGALEIKVCTTAGKVRVSQQPWSVALDDGSRVSTTGLSGGDFPRPEFPQDAVVMAGDCVRGLVMIPVPKGERPERAIYGPEGLDPAEWKIPPK
ncbi:hypothetical protein ACIGW8_22185 [Streptomyces sioyaensis]|uniref:hypothetical protein n=1 Tax=Streptomyces sioyaensis TaxID=67364 RepID=UPI0037D5FEF3